MVPSTQTMKKPSAQNTRLAATQIARPLVSNLMSSQNQWIEDLPIEEMKLFYDQFKQVHHEFVSMSDLTRVIME